MISVSNCPGSDIASHFNSEEYMRGIDGPRKKENVNTYHSMQQILQFTDLVVTSHASSHPSPSSSISNRINSGIARVG